MGKRLIQQRRGRGTSRYRAPDFKWKGKAKLVSTSKEGQEGTVKSLINCPGHSAPLMQVEYADGNVMLVQAPEGVRVGQSLENGSSENFGEGCISQLQHIPEGTPIFNIESKPGDGGRFVKTTGTFAKIVTKMDQGIVIQLPSGKRKTFLPTCRAMIGVVAGGGRKEKPFLKAGKKHFAKKAKNKLYPKVCGISMNAVDHPFGGGSSSVKGRPTQPPRNAPPGRKVGKIAPKRTGRRKR